MKLPPCPKVLRKKASEIGRLGDDLHLVVNFTETTIERKTKKIGCGY